MTRIQGFQEGKDWIARWSGAFFPESYE